MSDIMHTFWIVFICNNVKVIRPLYAGMCTYKGRTKLSFIHLATECFAGETNQLHLEAILHELEYNFGSPPLLRDLNTQLTAVRVACSQWQCRQLPCLILRLCRDQSCSGIVHAGVRTTCIAGTDLHRSLIGDNKGQIASLGPYPALMSYIQYEETWIFLAVSGHLLLSIGPLSSYLCGRNRCVW
jgi:hypothetical protein